MIEERGILNYQREVSRAAARPVRLVEDLNWEPPRTREAAFLELEGWSYKIRCGLRIWQRPDNGFYVSEEVAYEMAKQGEE
jgi:hypothetical protein